ncbi:hypothetical protein AYO44_01175 [Planctomycetaceae bacterium SCGC AG-212-F19]|nr:hypothetical protein AYO44_01175 [Planctomycetaceae bacterium SCGC AG-212-F19]
MAAVVVLITALGPVRAEAPKNQGDGDPAVDLVRQLADRSFERREEATKRLLQIGRSAKQALLEGLKAPDLEVQTRCERILVTVLEEDFKARLEAYVADKDGKQDHDLPGLGRWRKLIGNDAGSRELYVEMARTHGRLLEEATLAPKAVGEKFAGECQNLFQRVYAPTVTARRQITLADVTAMMFIGSDPEVAVTDNARQLIANLLYQPAFSTAVRSGPRSEQVRKLFAAWVVDAKGPAANQALNMALQYNLKEGLDLALRLLDDKDFAGGMAVVAIGRLGTKDHLKLLEPLLSDKTVLLNVNFNNKPGTTEVRDVALAMMVHLTGQPIRDYGYEFFRGTNNEVAYMAPVYLAFAETAKRDAAFKKWEDWKAKQPRP